METSNSNALVELSTQLAAAVAAAEVSIAYVDAHPRRDASGIAWDEHHLVTVAHAIEREEDIELFLPDGAKTRATLIGSDPSTDVAVLHTESELAPARRSDGALAVGNLVLAVGRDDDGQPAASFGVIGSLDGPWRTWRGGAIDRFIRADLNVYPGFSGGALIDASGGLVGMNTWGLSRRTALTLPVATVERVAVALRNEGRVARPYLGVALQAVRLPRALRERHALAERSAAIVVDAAPGGPAAQAGIGLGDVVLALDEAPIEDPDDLQRALAAYAVGAETNARILRSGELHDVRVTLAGRPDDDD